MDANIINAHTADIIATVILTVSVFFTIFVIRIINQDRHVFYFPNGNPRYKNAKSMILFLYFCSLFPGVNIAMFLLLV